MLQQTQVATVWPFYKRWMNAYPSIGVLASASIDHVLKNWEGLGYYSRARNLHKGACHIIEQLEGTLPTSMVELQKIPGIGPYTAAAIASMAYGIAAPLIDGNVLRVFTRVTRRKDDVSKVKTKTIITSELEQLITPKTPGAFNQGLMDLGRVICTPKNPKCEICPLANVCQARKQNDMEQFPVKPKRKPIPHYQIVVGLIRRDGQLLIQKRPARGLLGGLWEFPGGKIEVGESGQQALLREIKEETALAVTLAEEIGTIQHAYTHFKVTMTAWFCDWVEGEAATHAASENRWIAFDALNQYAFPKANLKIWDLIHK